MLGVEQIHGNQTSLVFLEIQYNVPINQFVLNKNVKQHRCRD